MKRRAVLVWVPALLAWSCTTGWASDRAPASEHVVICHVNDTHGSMASETRSDGRPVLGVARLAAAVRAIRAAAPGRVLFLHAGDVMSRGGPLSSYFGGRADFGALARAGVDVLTPGNGDFYWGPGHLQGVVRGAPFTVLHANIAWKASGGALFPPYTVRRVGALRVGILGVGVVYPDHPGSRDLTYSDPIGAAKRLVPRLRQEADVVIALTHIGEEADRRLAAEVPGIDLIVGGHSHTRLDSPVRVPHTDGWGDTWIVQAGDLFRFLGRVDLRAECGPAGWRVSRVDGRLIPLDARFHEAPDIRAYLAPFLATLDKVIGRSEVALPHPDAGKSPAGVFVSQALRRATGADLALVERSAIGSGISPGPVTLADVQRTHPWRNGVVLARLSGAQLREALSGLDVSVSGLDGRSLSDAGDYSVAMTEFLFYTTSTLRGALAAGFGERLDVLIERAVRSGALAPAPPTVAIRALSSAAALAPLG